MVTNVGGLKGLQERLNGIAPGAKVDVYIGLDKDLSESELSELETKLLSNGVELAEPVSIGSDDWPNTLRLSIYNVPYNASGISVLPLVVLIIGALGVVTVGIVLGYKIGNVFNAIASNIIPISIIIVGGILAFGYAQKKAEHARA